MASQTLESMLACTKAAAAAPQQQEKKAKPSADEQSLKCPRCESTNTKFCYYNNYSLSQPRYFCKSCRRYWTKGGTLRNVPVGGGCRKNKRVSSRARTHDPLSSLTSSPIHPPLIPSLTALPYDRPIICNPNNNNNVVNPCDVLENYSFLGGGFLQTPTTNGLFHSLCYGIGGENSNSVEWNTVENGGSGEMGNSYDQDRICSSGVKQEVCYGRDEGQSRLNYWGFPWQIGGEAGNMGGNTADVISSSRQSWNENGFGPYSWQGLINSPLM